jgi:hypothetical protein
VSALAAVAAWLQPALVAAVVFRISAGAPDAPWLALGALIAPLIALLADDPRPQRNVVTAAASTVTVTLLLAANLLVAADGAVLLGGSRWLGVVLGAALVLAAGAWPVARRVAVPALLLAFIALLLGPIALAPAGGGAPWNAWHRNGARPALTFTERSPWVQSGKWFAHATTLRFTEGQRVVTVAAGVYRVIERDAASPTVREWRLAAGDVLTLRPGDELSVEAGARLRFEAGRRVPGAPASGVEWADAPARGPRLLPVALGALITVLGGALALVPVARRSRAAALGPIVLLAATVTALGWGLYAAMAPDLVLGAALPAPLLLLPTAILGAAGVPLALVTAGALLVLLGATAVALRERLAAAATPTPELWLAALLAATAVAWWPLDAWRVLTLALGVAAAAWAPARLATSSLGALAGPIVGGVVFAGATALPALAAGTPAWLEALVRYPALVAFPLGWAAARAMPPDGEREAPGR